MQSTTVASHRTKASTNQANLT